MFEFKHLLCFLCSTVNKLLSELKIIAFIYILQCLTAFGIGVVNAMQKNYISPRVTLVIGLQHNFLIKTL